MYISVIIPCYNEIKTIKQIVDKVIALKNLKTQIIIIDDASTDGTTQILKNDIEKKVSKVIYHTKNLGKGASIRSSLKYLVGDLVIIQDADLEYDPNDYYKLIDIFDKQKVNVVYGSRILNKKYFDFKKGIRKNYRVFGNLILTFLSNIINNQNLTDAHTCYKMFKKELFLKLDIQENDFAFCPEVNTKISLLNEKILEVPINYQGREVEEGKKISFYDALVALKVIIKYKFFFKF